MSKEQFDAEHQRAPSEGLKAFYKTARVLERRQQLSIEISARVMERWYGVNAAENRAKLSARMSEVNRERYAGEEGDKLRSKISVTIRALYNGEEG